MNLTQKAREIFEKFFGKVEEKLLFTSDKEFFTNHINFTFGESFVKTNIGYTKIFFNHPCFYFSSRWKNRV
ncbi:hypothetical protein DSX44_04410 [Campylobacter jejuni]|nr:hypothetical protein [Campylobacter jejuni]